MDSKAAKPDIRMKEMSTTLFDGGPEGETVLDDGQFPLKTGDVLGYRSWSRKDTVTGLLFILHGLHEHGGRYAPVAHWFADKGYSIYAHDHVAHGKSYGERSLITDHGRLIADAVEFITTTAGTDENAALPVYVLGHSMGSLVTTAALVELQSPSKLGPRLRKVVFSGCPLRPGPASASPLGIRALYPLTKVGPLFKGLARGFAALDPSGPNTPIDERNLSHDPAVLERHQRDGLSFQGKVKNKTGLEFIRLADAARKAAPSVKVPAFLFHGADDEIAYPDGSRELLGLLGSETKSLKIYPNGFHEVLNEPFYPDVCAEVHSFFTAE